jgi:hypothetical protein
MGSQAVRVFGFVIWRNETAPSSILQKRLLRQLESERHQRASPASRRLSFENDG